MNDHGYVPPHCDIDYPVQTVGDSNEARIHSSLLHIAARRDDKQMVRFLLEQDANPTAIDIWGHRADQVAGPYTQPLLEAAREAWIAKYTRVNAWSGSSESVEVRTKAIQRLMRDIKAMYTNPIPNIRVIPLETNIFEWHIVMTPPPRPTAAERDFYPFTGIRFHFCLQFPEDYPRSPPTLTISHWIKHPNVFTNGIFRFTKKRFKYEIANYSVCLDMLEPAYYGEFDWESGSHQRLDNSSWTPSYTVESILIQLQAFLFDESIPVVRYERSITKEEYYERKDAVVTNEVSPWDRKGMVRDAEHFKCRECGYGLTFRGVNYKDINDLQLGRVERPSEEIVVPDKEPREMTRRELKLWLRRFNPKIPTKKVTDSELRAKLVDLLHRQALKYVPPGSLGAGSVAPTKKVTGKHRTKTEEELVDAEALRIFNFWTNTDLVERPSDNEALTREVRRLVQSGQKSVASQLRPAPLVPGVGPCLITWLPQYVILEIFDYLPRIEDVSSLMRAHSIFRIVAERYSIWTRRELNCFFTRAPFQEEILGIGIYVERHRGGNRLKTLRSSLDLISRSAFLEDELRCSAYSEPFHYWLPLPLTKSHAKFSIPLAKSMLVAIHENILFQPPDRFTELERKRGPTTRQLVEFDQKMESLRQRFDPLIVLDVLPKMMNHMVVSLMGGGSTVPLHASERALLGYCSYHHLVLNLVQEFPALQQKVDSIVSEFLRHQSARVKLVTPDLGELLVLLAFTSKYKWEEISTGFLQEFFDRLVVWMLDIKHSNRPELAFLEQDEVSEYRLRTTLEITKTSTRLLMFQVFFLQKVARRGGLPLAQILDSYNFSYGRPPVGTAEMLCEETRKIHAVSTWQEFYDRIGLPLPEDSTMTTILRQAVLNSEAKGYHHNPFTQATLLEWRSMRDLLLADGSELVSPRLGQEVPAGLAEEIASRTFEYPTTPFTQPVTLFCGNLSYRVSQEELVAAFRQFGNVQAKIILDENGSSRGFAFVTFPNPAIAETVLSHLSGFAIAGREIHLRRLTDRRPAPAAAPLPTPSEPTEWKEIKAAKPAKTKGGNQRHGGKSAPTSASKAGKNAPIASKTTPKPGPATSSANPAPKNPPAPARAAKKAPPRKPSSQNPFDLLEEE